MRVLFSDSHVTLSFDEARELVRYVRSELPFESLDLVRTLHGKVMAALPNRSGLKLILDVRNAPPRNDPEFESEITRMFSMFLPKFAAHAVLTRTAAGRLQAQRLERQQRARGANVFQTEAEALRFLGVS